MDSDKLVRLARALVPSVVVLLIVIFRVGSPAGLILLPFVAFGVVATLRRSGIFGDAPDELRGSVAESIARGRERADEILSDTD